GLAEVQFDVVASVPGGLVHEAAVALLLAEEVPLGQRRSLVRVVALVAAQYHAAGEALRSQRLGRLGAGQSAPPAAESLIRVDLVMPPCNGVAICERPAPRMMPEGGVTRSGHAGHPCPVSRA